MMQKNSFYMSVVVAAAVAFAISINISALSFAATTSVGLATFSAALFVFYYFVFPAVMAGYTYTALKFSEKTTRRFLTKDLVKSAINSANQLIDSFEGNDNLTTEAYNSTILKKMGLYLEEKDIKNTADLYFSHKFDNLLTEKFRELGINTSCLAMKTKIVIYECRDIMEPRVTYADSKKENRCSVGSANKSNDKRFVVVQVPYHDIDDIENAIKNIEEEEVSNGIKNIIKERNKLIERAIKNRVYLFGYSHAQTDGDSMDYYSTAGFKTMKPLVKSANFSLTERKEILFTDLVYESLNDDEKEINIDSLNKHKAKINKSRFKLCLQRKFLEFLNSEHSFDSHELSIYKHHRQRSLLKDLTISSTSGSEGWEASKSTYKIPEKKESNVRNDDEDSEKSKIERRKSLEGSAATITQEKIERSDEIITQEETPTFANKIEVASFEELVKALNELMILDTKDEDLSKNLKNKATRDAILNVLRNNHLKFQKQDSSGSALDFCVYYNEQGIDARYLVNFLSARDSMIKKQLNQDKFNLGDIQSIGNGLISKF